MPIINRIGAFAEEMTAWRRDLHAHPEIAFEEHRTADFVATKLAEWGIAVHRGLAGTGVVGTLSVGQGHRSIAIRADMDALPMPEVNDFAHRSTVPGKMHACGHDGHTSILLGAAKYLAETRNFDGTIHFIFQPAEENGGGADVMIREGLFEQFPVDAVYGLHNDVALPVGQASVVTGPVMAAADMLKIIVKGRGGHAARPELAVDPVMVGAQILTQLQTVISRRIRALDAAVISICQFHGGTTDNVIPGEAVLSGTVRTLDPKVQDVVEAAIKSLVTGIASAHGASAEVGYKREYPATINHAAETERAAAAAVELLGAESVIRKRDPVMGAEDFSFMLLKRPGCYIRLGQNDAEHTTPVHNSAYDFNDALLPIGASLWSRLVERELPRN